MVGFIVLLRLGDVPDAELLAAKAAIESYYSVKVETPPATPLPKSAYYAPRKRYRAEKLMAALPIPDGALRVIGITTADISTTKDDVYDWGILGLGEIDGKTSVISSFRCKMKARDAAHARERLGKVAVHEVGHTMGLEHCPNAGCIMHDAEGKVATVDTERDLCPKCRLHLQKRGVSGSR